MSVKIIHYPDIGFTVAMRAQPYSVSFKIYAISGSAVEVNKVVIYYASKEGDEHATESLEEAEVAFEGSIRWDGRSDLLMGMSDYDLYGRRHLKDVTELMHRLYDLAKEYIKPSTIEDRE